MEATAFSQTPPAPAVSPAAPDPLLGTAAPSPGARSAGRASRARAAGADRSADLKEVEDLQRPVDQLKSDVERLENAVKRNLENDQELTRLRTQLLNVFDQASAARDAIKPKREALRQQAEQLGPTPDKDAAPEAANVAAERARLTAKAAELDGALKNIELTVVRANQLRDTLQQARQELFASHLLRRSPSPVMPATWDRLAEDLPAASFQVRDTFSDWWAKASGRVGELAALIGGVVLLMAIMVGLLRRFVGRRLDAPRENSQVSSRRP